MEIGLFIIVALCILAAGGVTYYLVRSDRGVDAELQSPPPKIDLPGRTTGAQEVPSAPVPGDLDAESLGAAPYLEPPPVVKPSFFDRLSKARSAFTGYLGGLVGLGSLSDDDWEDLEEALIRADVGVQTSMRLIEDVRASAKEAGAEDGTAILGLLKERMRTEISEGDRRLSIKPDTTNVWLFVGVNGVGKTTTIGKLGKRLAAEGHTPLMAAGDTFRAAAAEQLTMWAERAGSEIVRGNEGGDPSSVIYDGVEAAAARGCNIVLADTAGRLQNKTNLMEELSKVRRVAEKGVGEVTETLLVLDATTGQNGMSQAKIFAEAVDVTGVILTKLDGSAKGGIVFAIESELGIPVKLVGLGEQVDDLVDFDSNEFVDALFE
ncbi:MAG: signal recognition particle-docking protein FtsY [Acidimicrobiales bacterium]